MPLYTLCLRCVGLPAAKGCRFPMGTIISNKSLACLLQHAVFCAVSIGVWGCFLESFRTVQGHPKMCSGPNGNAENASVPTASPRLLWVQGFPQVRPVQS